MALTPEDLRAIQILLEPLREDTTALREEATALREETTALREETTALREETTALREETTALREETTALREETTALREETKALESRMTHLEISYENKTDKILNLLREDYSRVAIAAKKTADYDEVKSTVNNHQHALENHNRRIITLEQKAI